MGFFWECYLPQFFGSIIAILIGAYIYVKYVAYKYWSSRGIAEAEAVAPFGTLWSILRANKSMGEFFRDLYLQFRKSPVVGMYMLYKPGLVVNDPDLLRVVLTKEFSHFQDRGLYCNEKVDPLAAHLFLLSGTKWKNLRHKLSPTFTSGKMKHMFATVEETGRELAESVIDKAREGELVEVKDLMFRYSTDVIASVAFGIKCNSLQNPEAEFLKWGRKVFEPRPVKTAFITMFPKLLGVLNISIADKDISNFFISVFKETVEYRTANNVVRKDFLDLLMQLMNKGYVHGDEEKETVHISDDADGKITMLEAAAQAFVFWAAGFETSSSTATYCLYELSLHQDLQDEAADEINRVLEEFGGITYESVNAMHYLHKVVSETLRKYPSLPMLNRMCNQDTDLPGINLRVAKGTAIVIPVMGIHWDPEIYPEPEKFDPERFNDANIAGRHQYAYLPFGEGPRNCIGMRFGLLQTKIGIISLLSKYRFRPGPNMQIPIVFMKGHGLLCAEGGVTLRIENR